jgi:hypothetical protein
MSSKQYSQRGQDLFVINILKEKKNGTFLDFGCRGPLDINNTYLLETAYNFSGLSFDIDANELSKWHSSGRNYRNAILCDLMNNLDAAMDKINSFYTTTIIDYFSFDLEPPLLTLDVLKRFPFDKYKFGIVTYEHDFYRGYDTLGPSRKIFIENGYRKIKKEYMHRFDEDKGIHLSEDWWIHPEIVAVDENWLDVEIVDLTHSDVESYYNNKK